MPTTANARITLELETGADPIRGSIQRADGSRQHFWGWLELIDELGRAAAGEPEQPSRPAQANTPERGLNGPPREVQGRAISPGSGRTGRNRRSEPRPQVKPTTTDAPDRTEEHR